MRSVFSLVWFAICVLLQADKVANKPMAIGISLSQLIDNSPPPLRSGVAALDDALGGWHSRCIYELFGPPGTSKTRIAQSLVQSEMARDGTCLWVDAHVHTPLETLATPSQSARPAEADAQSRASDAEGDERASSESPSRGLHRTRLTSFAQYVFFFQNLRERYELVVLQGFSQVLTDYIHARAAMPLPRADSAHAIKVKSLITLFTLITKYAHAYNATIVLVSDAMNTSYMGGVHHVPQEHVTFADDSRFLMRALKRRPVQVLRSALVANLGIGPHDHLWEVFVRRRVALMWDWDWRTPFRRVPRRMEVALVYDPARSAAALARVELQDGNALARERGREREQNDQEGAADHVILSSFSSNMSPPQLSPGTEPPRKRAKPAAWQGPSEDRCRASQALPLTPRFQELRARNTDPRASADVLYDSEG